MGIGTEENFFTGMKYNKSKYDRNETDQSIIESY